MSHFYVIVDVLTVWYLDAQLDENHSTRPRRKLECSLPSLDTCAPLCVHLIFFHNYGRIPAGL